MKHRVFASLLGAVLASTQAFAGAPKVAWILKYSPDATPNPNTVITLAYGSKKVLISKGAGEFSVLKRSEFKARHVPSTALIACTGWWAGGGDTYYVKKVGSYLRVYDISQDEQSADGLRVVKRIKL